MDGYATSVVNRDTDLAAVEPRVLYHHEALTDETPMSSSRNRTVPYRMRSATIMSDSSA
jgi:hypothetical protein